MPLDISSIRRQFPFLHGPDAPVYLDSAATTQKPQTVIDAISNHYKMGTANAHRGVHMLGGNVTDAYEDARKTVADFIVATHADEIVFTKNATEALNLLARCMGESILKKGDTVLLSILEHHANIVPWLQLKEKIGIKIQWIDCDSDGQLDMKQYESYLQAGDVKVVSVSGQSNVLGTQPNIQKITAMAHEHGATVIIDAAQLIAHEEVNVQEIDCDALVFSGHKIYGPSGIGVLYGKRSFLKELPPFLGGGIMIKEVTTEGFEAADAPQKFEAGTMPIVEAIALSTALQWLQEISLEQRKVHEHSLMKAALTALGKIEGLKIIGPKDADKRSGCISFTIHGVHPHDLTDILGEKGFMLRAGNHCAEPLHTHLQMNGSSRMSFGIYNTEDDVKRCTEEMAKIVGTLRRC